MIFAAAVGILLLTTALNLAVETSAELTAEVLADTDLGIATGTRTVSSSAIVDTSPEAMLILPEPTVR